ncbi:MAG TPA: M23 family metallopeptidase [Bacteroidota bacterium]|nr:M23 family metallopeptidase [Bacteroidota bacterium]
MSPAPRAAAALILCASLAPARAGDTTGSFRWPLPSGRVVTSAFGEYRPGHFHAGIDISSGDVTGSAVLASRAGYIARISVSPTGYGKKLEIRHAEGFTTVYAHMEAFAPALEQRVRRDQLAHARYPVDIACAPDEFPVAAGDLIGYTGSTGAASPHLHFEVRDGRGDPVNPFRWPSLRIPDNIPPVIRRIAVVPIGPEATVNGEHGPLALRRGNPVRPVVVTGTVGIAVEGRDRMPGSRFLNGVYARTLFLDGKVIFAERLDRTPWNETHEIELCYEHGLPGGRYARLFVNSPNHLGTYTPALAAAGIIDAGALTPGAHALRIVCADYAGNGAEAHLTLVAGRDAAHPRTTGGDFAPGPMQIACAPDDDGIDVLVTADAAFPGPPAVTVEEGEARTAVIVHRVSPRAYRGHFTPRGTIRGTRRVSAEAASHASLTRVSTAIDVEPVLPGTAGEIALDGGALVIGYDSLSVLKPLFLCVTKSPDDGDTVYRLAPGAAVLGSGLSVRIRPRAGDPHGGLFARRTGAWQYIGGRGSPAAGRIRVRLGEVALLDDSTPPALLGLRVARGLITARFGDDLSGVEYDSLKTYIDGQLVIPEIDGRRRRAIVDSRERFARGPHQLTLRLADRMGNTRTTVRRLFLR